MSWSRRIGVVLGLLLLGASIVLAGQALDRGDGLPGGAPSPSAPGPPPAPVLLPPRTSVTGSATTDISGTLPNGFAGSAEYVLRIYRDDQLVRERRLPESSPWTVRDVALSSGDNTFSAAIYGPGGESLHSAAIVITLDDQPPALALESPAGSDTMTTDARVTIAVRTDANATVTVLNRATNGTVDSVAGEDGRFSSTLALAAGRNAIVISSTNALGITATLRIVVERITSQAAVTLVVEPGSVNEADLPAKIDLTATIDDTDGRPADGATVVFSVSPPGQPTATYTTTSVDGVARWPNFRLLPGNAAAGRGRATVMVMLADGEQLTDYASFTVR